MITEQSITKRDSSFNQSQHYIILKEWGKKLNWKLRFSHENQTKTDLLVGQTITALTVSITLLTL